MGLTKKYNVAEISQKNAPQKNRLDNPTLVSSRLSSNFMPHNDKIGEPKYIRSHSPTRTYKHNCKETGDDDGDDDDDDGENSTSFGIFGWRPQALQCLAANLWPFVGFFGFSGMCVAASTFYMRSQTTSIERHFRISSSRMGVLMAANDIGSVVVVLFASHFGKNAHIPRMLALLTLLSGLFYATLGFIQAFNPEKLPTAADTSAASGSGSQNGTGEALSILQQMMMSPIFLCMGMAGMGGAMSGNAFGGVMGDPSSGSIQMPPEGIPIPPPGDMNSMTMPPTGDLNGMPMPPPGNMNEMPMASSGSMTGMPITDANTSSSLVEGMPNMGSMDMSSMMSMGDIGDALSAQPIHWGYYYTFVVLFIIGALTANRIPMQIFYVESNVRTPVEAGIRIGILTTATMFGNPLSLLIGGVLQMLPVDLGDTQISFMDSRWIGAWWLGFVVFGLCTVVFTIPVFCLPKRVKGRRRADEQKKVVGNRNSKDEEAARREHGFKSDLNKQRSTDNESEEGFSSMIRQRWGNMKEFFTSTRHIITNPVILLVLFYSFTMILGISGTMSFQFKYIENQYDMPAYSISLYLGIGMMLTVVVGTFLGGAILTRFKLGLSGMFRMALCGGLFSVICSVIIILLGCDNHQVVGFNEELGNASDVRCQCIPEAMLVVCGSDGRNYLSPCLAGCTQSDGIMFSKCSYIGGESTAVPGFCSNCDLFPPFMACVTLVSLFLMITMTPQALMIARLVPLHEQPIVTSLASVILTVGMLVGPIIFGNIYDSTCALWPPMGGPCTIPDKSKLRSVFLAADIGIRSSGILALIIAIFLMRCTRFAIPDHDRRKNETINITMPKSRLENKQMNGVKENGNGNVYREEPPTRGIETDFVQDPNEQADRLSRRSPQKKLSRSGSDKYNKVRGGGKPAKGSASKREQPPSMLGLFDGKPGMQMSNISLPPASGDNPYNNDTTGPDDHYAELVDDEQAVTSENPALYLNIDDDPNAYNNLNEASVVNDLDAIVDSSSEGEREDPLGRDNKGYVSGL